MNDSTLHKDQVLSSTGDHQVLLDFLNWRESGLQCALVTLVGVEGSAPQPIGSQMVVNEKGAWSGRISSGCAEAAIASEAVRAIEGQRRFLERYGAGSQYLDISLPCGSGLDVFFDPFVPTDIIDELSNRLRQRQACGLKFNITDASSQREDFGPSRDFEPYEVIPLTIFGPGGEEALLARQVSPRARCGSAFTKMYFPRLRVALAGRGPVLRAVAHLADVLGWEVAIASPDFEMVSDLGSIAQRSVHLTSPEAYDAGFFDGWTAAVLLFHDHDWEPRILEEILRADGFYVGALGSRKTHQSRCAALIEMGCEAQRVEDIRGPVGLDIGSRSSEEIALAIVGEILAVARCPSHLKGGGGYGAVVPVDNNIKEPRAPDKVKPSHV